MNIKLFLNDIIKQVSKIMLYYNNYNTKLLLN